MPEIKVKTIHQGVEYQVIVREGSSETKHVVTVPDAFYQKLTNGKISQEACVKHAFEFLLDREPKESIYRRFDLPVISQYFPEFEKEFKRYCS